METYRVVVRLLDKDGDVSQESEYVFKDSHAAEVAMGAACEVLHTALLKSRDLQKRIT